MRVPPVVMQVQPIYLVSWSFVVPKSRNPSVKLPLTNSVLGSVIGNVIIIRGSTADSLLRNCRYDRIRRATLSRSLEYVC
jgi:hypothetical protein